MAKLHQGLFGQFSGKIGNVVGYILNGKQCVREYVIPKQANTECAKANRVKFSMAVKFASGIKEALPFLYPGSKGAPRWNQALRNILNTGFTAENSNISIDYSKVAISAGCTHDAVTAKAKGGYGIIVVTWSRPKNINDEKPGNKVIMVAYCEAINKCVVKMVKTGSCARSKAFSVSDLKRAERAKRTKRAERAERAEVHTWLVFTGSDEMQVLNCTYAGKVTILQF